MSAERYDAIIVGAGQAGPPLAGRLTQAGMTVALVERHLVGGTCVNTGCMPTKTLVASARAAHVARHGADWGITLPGPIAIDMPRVKARADTVTLNARSGLERWLGGMKGLTLVRGQARFESARTVRVGDRLLEAERIFINVGGRATIPDMPGVHDVPILTNTQMLEIAEVPQHLVVVGGSYIGLEFAQMYRRFGAEVTIVEKGSRLVAREDEETSETIRAILEREGIAMRLDAECIHFSRHGGGIAVGVDCTEGPPEVVGSHVLLAVGRTPNTADLGLDAAGVEMDARGYVHVDDHLRTSAPGIWALGDCNGRGAFTHTSYNDFEIVAANLLDGEDRKLSDRLTAYALYIDPPLGRCGMTEAEAKQAGHRLLVGKRPMTRVGRANEMGESQGFMKILVDADSRQILGGAVLGVSGDEAIHSILDMMYCKAPVDALTHAVHIHPTVSELIPTIAGELQAAA